MPLKKTYSIEKVYHLSQTDLKKLDVLILHNFDKYKAYDSMFPEKKDSPVITKQRYFSTIFKKNEQEAWEYIDKIYTRKYKDLYLTRERLILDIFSDIQEARERKDFKSLTNLYTLIAKMCGYLIERHQVSVEKEIEIQYILPNTIDDNSIKIEAVEINDQI